MKQKHRPSTVVAGQKARFFIWSIRRQDAIAAAIVRQVWSAVCLILLLTLAYPIKLETALEAILYGGLGLVALLWLIIERRRSWLLNLEDARLRAVAHDAMLDYIRRKVPGAIGQNRLNGKRPCPHC